MNLDKKTIHKQLIDSLTQKISQLKRDAQAQKEAATNDESKAENKYDTRGLEASYMAQAQSFRVKEMEKDLYTLTRFNTTPFSEKIKVV